MQAMVVAVSLSARHSFSKTSAAAIRLIAGHGVAGDVHAGATVKHRSRVAKDPAQPNLRQVHLIAAETLDELREEGFGVAPGAIGENVTTRGIDLFALPEGARLGLGQSAVVEITGLRNPCVQLDRFQNGLMQAVLGRDAKGGVTLRAGIMGVVLASGDVRPGDAIKVTLPDGERRPLKRI
jgi:MOSC domain-containing protein YiiM